MNRWKSKAGFTLMEVMVVAIIVAILAVITPPIMNANRRRAWATEAQVGCGTVRTALRIMLAADGVYPTMDNTPIYPAIPGIAADELDGTYFRTTDYHVVSTPSNYTITCTGTSPEVAGRTVILDSAGVWSGTLLE